MPPYWLQILSQLYVPLSIASAALVLADIYLIGRRQHMPIMEAVWPLTLLYWGPVGLIYYGRFGRAGGARRGAHSSGHKQHAEEPMWQATFVGATHCGAGCALGDFIGDWLAFATGLVLFGSQFGGKILLAFALAYTLGIGFQYFSVAPMKGLSLRDGLIAAIEIDTLSLVAYEVGMFAWMGFRAWLYPDLPPTSWAYWLMMQIAMVVGFTTTYPVNWWLIRRGIKEAM